MIVAVPAFIAETSPPPDTVAAAGLLLDHVTLWFVALDGVINAKRFSVLPTTRLVDVLLRDMPVTGITIGLTVTVQEA